MPIVNGGNTVPPIALLHAHVPSTCLLGAIAFVAASNGRQHERQGEYAQRYSAGNEPRRSILVID